MRLPLVLTLLLGGCAGAPPALPPGLPPRAAVNTPFWPQQMHQCGPAALAGMLGWSGVAISPEQLAAEVYLPGRKGSLQAELITGARRHGRLAYRLEPYPEALLAELAAGHPVLVLQNLGLDWWPHWHYAVVTGYDLTERELILNSGALRGYHLALSTFLHTWERAGNWALLVLLPERLPATVSPAEWLSAAANLEAQDPAAAERAYARARARWPEDPEPPLALANLRLQQGDRPGAEQALRESLAAAPDYVPALNNLAWLLLQRGELEQAEPLARRAASRPGPFRAGARDTLRQIHERLMRPELPGGTASAP